jgi:hypothetical protein
MVISPEGLGTVLARISCNLPDLQTEFFLEEIRILIPNLFPLHESVPITVAPRAKAGYVFACSNTGIVGSNPTQNMDVSLCLFCVCAR